jgi:hypothetical protein
MDGASDDTAYDPLEERESTGSVACLAIDDTPNTEGIARATTGDIGSVPWIANDDMLSDGGKGD